MVNHKTKYKTWEWYTWVESVSTLLWDSSHVVKCQISLINVQSTIHIQLVSLSAGEKISVKDALVDPRSFGHKWEHWDGPQDGGLEQPPGPNQQIINDKKIKSECFSHSQNLILFLSVITSPITGCLMNIFVRYFLHMPKVFQPSCQNEVFADNVSANHRCIQICMCHMLHTVHFLRMCHHVHITCLLPECHVRRLRGQWRSCRRWADCSLNVRFSIS